MLEVTFWLNLFCTNTILAALPEGSILGKPPLNKSDALSVPIFCEMYDFFPDFTKFILSDDNIFG